MTLSPKILAAAASICLPAELDAQSLALRGFSEAPIGAEARAALDVLFRLETGLDGFAFRRFDGGDGACVHVARDGCRLKLLCGEARVIDRWLDRVGGAPI